LSIHTTETATINSIGAKPPKRNDARAIDPAISGYDATQGAHDPIGEAHHERTHGVCARDAARLHPGAQQACTDHEAADDIDKQMNDFVEHE